MPVLLNKVVLEYIPKYGQRLADEVRKWGEWIKQEAEKELAEFYPKDADGAMPIAYLWARTIQCEGPGCGAEVPLIRSLWLAKKASRSVALQLVPNPKAKRVDFQIIVKERDGWVDQANPKDQNRKPEVRRHGETRFRDVSLLRLYDAGDRVREQLKARQRWSERRSALVRRDNPDKSARPVLSPADRNRREAISDASDCELENAEERPHWTVSLVPDETLDLARHPSHMGDDLRM